MVWCGVVWCGVCGEEGTGGRKGGRGGMSLEYVNHSQCDNISCVP